MRHIKILSYLCALLLLCSCTKSTFATSSESSQLTQSEVQSSYGGRPSAEPQSFSLPYFANDLLNPYTSKQSVNINLRTLLYDSLVRITPAFEVQNELAENISVSGVTCTVILRKNLWFSDGTALTAKDVVSCLQLAINSKNFANRYHNIASYKAEGEDKIIITLKTADIHFAKLLDFPILKIDSVKKNPQAPIGSGRYTYSEKAETSFIANPKWYQGDKCKLKKIKLVNIHDSTTMMYMLKTGNINFVYTDLSGSEMPTLVTSTASVMLNHMVYLGVNASHSVLADATVRKAIFLALDRENITAKGYLGRGLATSIPFNPKADSFTAGEYVQINPDTAAAIKLLETAGYDKTDKEGYRIKDNKRLSLRLVVNSDNLLRKESAEIIKNQLKEVGIGVEIISLAFSSYTAKISKWDFDLYLGEVYLSNNNDITSMLNANNSIGAGIVSQQAVLDSYTSYRAGNIVLDEFLKTFTQEVPFIPLMFRSGMAAFSRNLSDNIVSTASDPFYNIQDWSLS